MKINREGSRNNKIYYGQVQGITNAVKLVKVIGTLSLKFTIWRLIWRYFSMHISKVYALNKRAIVVF